MSIPKISFLPLICLLSFSSCSENASIEKETTPEHSKKTSHREEKTPGCQTMIELGVLSEMQELNVEGLTLNEAKVNFLNPVSKDSKTKIVQNKEALNGCTNHVIHVQNIPQTESGPKQIILSFLQDASNSNNTLSFGGIKSTCWKDANEMWRPTKDCSN